VKRYALVLENQSTVKYPEALDGEQETAKFLQLDLPEMGASTSIFLQIRDRD
jgi:hypothetical protein